MEIHWQAGELGIMKAAELLMPYGAFIVLGGGLISTLAGIKRNNLLICESCFCYGQEL
jgi:hypothetical protein